MKMYIYDKIWLNSSCIRNVADKSLIGNQNTHLALLLLFTTIEFSLGGSSPYTTTVNRYKNKIYINETTIKQSKQ
jgi:hypothetical protein